MVKKHRKNPVMVEAGKKAAITKKMNQEAEHQKWVEAGKKAYATKMRNLKRKAKVETSPSGEILVAIPTKQFQELMLKVNQLESFKNKFENLFGK